jgi:hypothetical protein
LDLSSLSEGHPLRLSRSFPLFCEGYLTALAVPANGIEGILEVIKGTYGGGTYRLQNTQLVPNGSVQFAAGHHTFKIAGNPIQNGREYAPDGTLVAPAVAPGVAAPTVVMQQPTGGATENRMLGMLQSALERASTGGGGVDIVSLVDGIKAMRGMMPEPPRQLDQFGQFEQFLGLMGKMQRFGGGADTSSSSGGGGDDDDGGLFGGGGGGMMEKLLMAKIMGGMGGSPQQQQPQQRPPQQFAPSPPPGYYGGHPQQQQWPPHQQPQQQQQHQQWQQPPQQPQQQPQQPPQQQQPPAAAAAPPTEPQTDEEDEYEPITAGDVVTQIQSMGEADQMEYMSNILKGLGMAGGLDGIKEGLGGHVNGAAPGVDFTAGFNQ